MRILSTQLSIFSTLFCKLEITTTFLMIIQEFKLRIFQESYPRIYKCISLLSQKQLWTKPSNLVNAPGSLILHVAGNARQWIVSGLGKENDIRDRRNEFIPHPTIRKTDLIFILENLKSQLNETIDNLDSKSLSKKVFIQGMEVSYFSALTHVIEHFSYHTGQLTILTKLYTNKETNYYDDSKLNS